MPWRVREDEIEDFFRMFPYVENSVLIGQNHEGRPSGFGAILFDKEEDAEEAVAELDQANIGARYVELSVMTYGDYLAFH